MHDQHRGTTTSIRPVKRPQQRTSTPRARPSAVTSRIAWLEQS
jgi:hypothetical protein